MSKYQSHPCKHFSKVFIAGGIKHKVNNGNSRFPRPISDRHFLATVSSFFLIDKQELIITIIKAYCIT